MTVLNFINNEKISKIKYKISKPEKKYIIFTEAYNKNWKLGNQAPIKLGPVNAYEYKNNNELKYTRFTLYLIFCLISMIFFIILAIT